ncbi:MAG: hypothetical protein IJV26_02860 [Lachnospiraceae bacterium]|nr:hypothetical protein [Lachnospiraceae bacterium]
MKKTTGLIAAVLSAALCAGLFAGAFAVPVQAVGSSAGNSAVTSGSGNTESSSKGSTVLNKLQKKKAEKEPEMPELYKYTRAEAKFTDDYSASIAFANYDELRLSEKSEAEYPELADILDKLATIKDEDYIDAYKDLCSRGQEIIDTGTKEEIEGLLPFQLDSHYFVRRADTALLSVAEEVELRGGGDELAYFQCFTFDVQTGEWIAPADCLTKPDETAQLLSEMIRDAYPNVSVSRNQLADKIMAAFESENFQWTAEQESMTFWFDANTIEENTGEAMIMSIPYTEETKEFFPAFYAPQDVPWGYYFPEYYPAFADLDGDGQDEMIRVWGGGPDDAQFSDWNDSLNISISGKIYKVPAEGYDLKPILVKTGGKVCLYACTIGSDDYRIISCFDLMEKEPEHLGDVLGGPPVYPYQELPEDFFEHYDRVPARIWTDFLNFKLDQRLYILGTSGGTRPFYISRTGLPVPDPDEPYEFDEQTDLKLLISMKVDRVDEDGKVTESVRLSRGAILTPYRTDGETYVDMITDDGMIVRFDLEANDWPHLVNGMDAEEVFEGMLYAG